MPRFFCSIALRPHTTINLPDALAHHALRVLRLGDGSPITLFDGQGGQYPASLLVQGRQAQARLGAHDPTECELQGRLLLLQGIAAGDKMDWVIEKAVELGVHTVVPVMAERSVLRLNGTRRDKRLAHWRAIVLAASEQCGRNRLMQVQDPAPLAACLADLTGPVLFAHPEGPQGFAQALQPVQHQLSLMVGPEGGWSENELALARRHGLQAVRFGARVLRTETAGLAMTAAATALLGW